MNFFDDDFGLGATPSYNKKQSASSIAKGNNNADNASKKSAKKDDYDDLLDDLLNKHEKKNNKIIQKQSLQPFSSTYLEPIPTLMDFKKTQKWSTPNIEFDFRSQSPKFPSMRQNSLVDQKGSEDGKSYKSGATGRQSNAIDLNNMLTLKPVQSKEEAPFMGASMRNMMKPPLRKKQSKEQLLKEPSIWNEEANLKFSRNIMEPISNLDIVSNAEIRSRSRDERNPSPQQRNKSPPNKQKIIEREKIVTVREQATQLRKQFDNEMKQVKQSYERQLKLANQKIRQQMENFNKQKIKLMKQNELKVDDERRRWQKLMSESGDRMKQMHDWQLKKKCQAYEMQIQKLKSIGRIQDQMEKKQSQYLVNQQNAEIKIKQRELQMERQKLDQFKKYLEQREKNVQFQEKSYENMRNKEEEKLQFQRKVLIQKENQLRKIEMESKRNFSLQKQTIASQLAASQIQLLKKKESLNLQKDELRMLRQLFERQKSQYQAFNKNILNDYKLKLKEVKGQKQHINQMEIQLHKKLHALEMTGAQFRPNKQIYARATERPNSSNQQNYRNRANTQLDGKLKETKDRFREMQSIVKKGNSDIQQQFDRVRGKVNLSGYMARLNRTLSKY